MMFRSAYPHMPIETARMEEFRREDARKAMEKECRALRKEFRSLEKDHHSLRKEYEVHSQRLDAIVVQSGALLSMISGLNVSVADQDVEYGVGCKIDNNKGRQYGASYFDEQVQISDRPWWSCPSK